MRVHISYDLHLLLLLNSTIICTANILCTIKCTLEIIPALYLVLFIHLQTEVFKQLGSSVVAHLLLTVVHSCNFKDNSKVSARFDRDGKAWHLYAENSGILIINAHSVVYLCAVPRLKLNYKVDLLVHLDSTHTEQSSGIDYSDTSEFKEMAEKDPDKLEKAYRTGRSEALKELDHLRVFLDR